MEMEMEMKFLFYFKHVITQIVFLVHLWLVKHFYNEEYLLWNGQVFSTYVSAKDIRPFQRSVIWG